MMYIDLAIESLNMRLKAVVVITSRPQRQDGKRRGERLFDHLIVPFGCIIIKYS